MSYYVHLHVSFECDRNEPVGALAQKFLDEPTNRTEAVPEVVWFLTDLSSRTGENAGPKGGLSLWGMIGNNTNVAAFCDVLKPFWYALLTTRDCGPLDFAHIIVFQEEEQSEQAVAFEIFLDQDLPEKPIKIVKHALPFSWRQF